MSSERNGHVLPFNARLEQDHDEKLRIARAAAGFVKPGMQIAVDGVRQHLCWSRSYCMLTD